MDPTSPTPNPYSSPAPIPESQYPPEGNQPQDANPFVPALIGLFTYGASSPYSLVLCIEIYLKRPRASISRWVHFATPLAVLGSIGWAALSLLVAEDTLRYLLGNAPSMNGSIGTSLWLANLIFGFWTIWRVIRFRKKCD